MEDWRSPLSLSRRFCVCDKAIFQCFCYIKCGGANQASMTDSKSVTDSWSLYAKKGLFVNIVTCFTKLHPFMEFQRSFPWQDSFNRLYLAHVRQNIGRYLVYVQPIQLPRPRSGCELLRTACSLLQVCTFRTVLNLNRSSIARLSILYQTGRHGCRGLIQRSD